MILNGNEIIAGDTIIHGATVNGIDVGTDVDNTHVHAGVKFMENANDILDNGVATYVEAADAVLFRKLMTNKKVTDPVTGILTVYDDDGVTVLLTANIYEDAAGTQSYRSRGLERQEKLS